MKYVSDGTGKGYVTLKFNILFLRRAVQTTTKETSGLRSGPKLQDSVVSCTDMACKEFCELLYKRPYTGKGQESETPEFIVLVLPSEFERWKAHPNEVALVEVVDAMEVFVSRNRAHTCKLEHATKAQFQDAFDGDKFEDIFAFMAAHGHLTNPPKHADFRHEMGGLVDRASKTAYYFP